MRINHVGYVAANVRVLELWNKPILPFPEAFCNCSLENHMAVMVKK